MEGSVAATPSAPADASDSVEEDEYDCRIEVPNLINADEPAEVVVNG